MIRRIEDDLEIQNDGRRPSFTGVEKQLPSRRRDGSGQNPAEHHPCSPGTNLKPYGRGRRCLRRRFIVDLTINDGHNPQAPPSHTDEHPLTA